MFGIMKNQLLVRARVSEKLSGDLKKFRRCAEAEQKLVEMFAVETLRLS
jgi:hypothetical protein